MGVIKKE